MEPVTTTRLRFTEKKLSRAAAILAGLVLAVSPLSARAQEEGAGPPALNGGPSFEVLDVTTGSGSRSQEDKPAMKIEILDLTPRSPEASAEAAQAEAEADASLTPAEKEARAREAALATALEQWHIRTLGEYSYNITSLEDPFMPIREVRGSPEGPGDPDAETFSALPPILRLELNQLRLVAITTRSGATGPGSALASFEDGAGASYILRRGDRIGRREGRITGITPDTVTVEEPPRTVGDRPRVTEIRLSTADTRGLTRLGGQADEMFPGTMAPGGSE